MTAKLIDISIQYTSFNAKNMLVFLNAHSVNGQNK